MAFAGNKTEIGIKATGSKCTVPDNDTAKLMYYLNCKLLNIQLLITVRM